MPLYRKAIGLNEAGSNGLSSPQGTAFGLHLFDVEAA